MKKSNKVSTLFSRWRKKEEERHLKENADACFVVYKEQTYHSILNKGISKHAKNTSIIKLFQGKTNKQNRGGF